MILGVSFFTLLLMGLPIGFVLLGAAIVFAFESGRIAVLGAFPSSFYYSLEIFDLLAIPLFILLGEIMSEGGITRQVFDSTARVLRAVPRALAYVCLVSNLMMAAILGSANAQVAVMSRVVLPEMESAGYQRSFSTVLTTASSLLGPIVPPSMAFIIYAVVAQVSVGKMFLAGILPGLLLFVLIAFVIALSPRVFKGDHTPSKKSRDAEASRSSALGVLGAMLVPFIVVGGILGGIMTPTESAGVALVAAIPITYLLFKPIPFKTFYEMLVRTAINSAIVLFLIAAARVFGFILTYYQVPQDISKILVGMSSNGTEFLLLVVALLLFVGAFVEGMIGIIILVPILLPTAVGIYGIDPIVLGVVVCMTLTVGLITPPVGTVLFIASAISGVRVGRLSVDLLPYIAAAIAVIIAVVFIPELANLLTS